VLHTRDRACNYWARGQELLSASLGLGKYEHEGNVIVSDGEKSGNKVLMFEGTICLHLQIFPLPCRYIHIATALLHILAKNLILPIPMLT
jgi:hypothetical protein